MDARRRTNNNFTCLKTIHPHDPNYLMISEKVDQMSESSGGVVLGLSLLTSSITKFWSLRFQNPVIHSLDISNFVEYIYGKLILQNCWQNQIPNNKLRYFPGSRQLIDQR